MAYVLNRDGRKGHVGISSVWRHCISMHPLVDHSAGDNCTEESKFTAQLILMQTLLYLVTKTVYVSYI